MAVVMTPIGVPATQPPKRVSAFLGSTYCVQTARRDVTKNPLYQKKDLSLQRSSRTIG
jgi:hypothetical protein